MLDAEDLEFLFGKTDTSEHEPVSFKSFDGVDPHAAHHFLDFMIPRRKQIGEAFAPDFRIQTLDEILPLRRDAPVALPALA